MPVPGGPNSSTPGIKFFFKIPCLNKSGRIKGSEIKDCNVSIVDSGARTSLKDPCTLSNNNNQPKKGVNTIFSTYWGLRFLTRAFVHICCRYVSKHPCPRCHLIEAPYYVLTLDVACFALITEMSAVRFH